MLTRYLLNTCYVVWRPSANALVLTINSSPDIYNYEKNCICLKLCTSTSFN